MNFSQTAITFLNDFMQAQDLNTAMSKLSYSERLMISIDLQLLQEALMEEVEKRLLSREHASPLYQQLVNSERFKH